jgi:hypothetical protein
MNKEALRNAQQPDEQLDVEAGPDATDAQLKRVSTLALRQLEIKREIEEIEEQLEKKNSELKINAESDLPEAMTTCGLQEVTIAGGATVELKRVVAASIPAEMLPEALAWLKEHKAESIVKHTITCEFGKGEDKVFKAILKKLGAVKPPLKLTTKSGVHAQTLGAFVREKDKAGVVVPEKTFGIFRVTKAEVKPPKLESTEV